MQKYWEKSNPEASCNAISSQSLQVHKVWISVPAFGYLSKPPNSEFSGVTPLHIYGTYMAPLTYYMSILQLFIILSSQHMHKVGQYCYHHVTDGELRYGEATGNLWWDRELKLGLPSPRLMPLTLYCPSSLYYPSLVQQSRLWPWFFGAWPFTSHIILQVSRTQSHQVEANGKMSVFTSLLTHHLLC